MKARIAVFFALLLGLAAGCLSAGDARVRTALERGKLSEAVSAYDRLGRPDTDLLRRIAAALLKEEALGSDPGRRDAALGQLAVAGGCGRQVLRELGRAAGRPGAGSVAGAKALALLAGLRDEEAARSLRELAGSEQPEIRAAAVSALRPQEDLERLLRALDSTYLAVRLAAARAFGAGPGDSRTPVPPPFSLERRKLVPAARIALAQAARLDPEPEVRSAALWSLANAGSEAADGIEEALLDPELGVRLAAIGALVRADRARARRVLGRLLESDLDQEGIEAARHLLAQGAGTGAGTGASAPGEEDTTGKAREFLHRALAASDLELRARAAVAMDALDESLLDTGRLLERIRLERVPRVRLSLVMAVRARAAEHRKLLDEALREIGASGGVSGAYAIAQLAGQGDPKAVRKLLSLLSGKSAAVRRVAVRAVARDLDRPHDARRALADGDPSVRIAAAGAILVSDA